MTEALQQEEPNQNGDTMPSSIDVDNQQNLANVPSSKRRSNNSIDPDAQEMLISSLRAQIQDLFAQVSQLNSKLVKSYDRVSDLEDDLHVASANLRSSSVKISQLELERTQHLSALNTGLLVEKSHVTTELNRLMEKATEEAAQRGQAESARMAIEKDLDDLSASLFDQANTMVAEARFGKHLSERKVEDAERALKSAEEAVQLMQVQMQSMQAEKEEMEKRSQKIEMMMGKGKWVERRQHDDDSPISLRLLSSHAPYQDYLAFISHLRILHPTSPSPPAMTTLLPLPFLARLLNEDSEPTVRLDLAPSLNWLSRRSVLAAIHSGQLTIEPISAASLFAESTYASSTTIAGVHSSNDNVSCALCGTPVFPVPESSRPTRPPVHPSNPHLNPSSWSNSFFKRTPSMGYMGNSRPPSPTHSITRSSFGPTSQIYIFKLASLPTSTIPSLPISSLSKASSQSISSAMNPQSASIHNSLASASPNNQPVTVYPLCMSGWCLSRLRTTCTLWAFVRSGIVEKVWEEVITPPEPPPTESHVNGEKPSLPPRKRGLWGIASAIGERAVSWSDGDKDKTKKPPPLHPQEQRRLPPSIPPSHPHVAANPPPLPKRNDGRSRNPATQSPPPRASIDNPTNTQSSPPAAATVSSSPMPTPPPIQETPVHVRTSSSDFTALPPRSPMRASLLPDRVRTPSNIPLPDSRPSTPPVLPSRTSSPAAVGSSGAPPPPLPRRAAARGVRGATAASASRPSTPVNGVEGVLAHSPLTTEVFSADPAPKADEKVHDKPNGNDNNGQLADAGNKIPDGPSQPSPSSDIFVDAPSPKGEDTQSVVGLVQEKGVKENEEDSKTAPVPSTIELKSATVNGPDIPDKVKTNGKINGDHVNGVMVENEKVNPKVQALEEEGEEEKEIEANDRRQYVGDDTWEEKTWKELVRLREDMFWARVGGIRG
ncbi:hypothetical protein BYT27DRAFT_7175194 [Phlegmacium glaucopus]|nr:hypothetical protein BYT27DRAFT_7175194 [Phlegmacium glaucopus]